MEDDMKTKKSKLPEGILKSDMKWSSKDQLTDAQRESLRIGWNDTMELWEISETWVIPTLLISKSRRGSGYQDRTYAAGIDGKYYRVGKGPHILQTVRIYIKQSNYKRLKKYIDLMLDGQVRANETRDRISTRRMQRAMFGRY
jgi:hypothetical protein